jgi:prophage regulatory protein
MRLIKRPEVEARTGLRHSSIYLKIQSGDFPSPVRTGAKGVAWVESEVDQWIERRIASRDEKAARQAAEQSQHET